MDAVALQRQSDPVVAIAAFIAQQSSRAAIGRQYDVGKAVAVDIGKGAATSDLRVEQVGPCVAGLHFLEATLFIAGVPEKLGRLLVGLAHGHDVRLQMAVAGEEIGTAVQVVVKEENTELEQRPARAFNSLG